MNESGVHDKRREVIETMKDERNVHIHTLHTRYLFVIIAFVLFLTSPQMVSAHASLIKAAPLQGSHLSQSPEKVVLAFNERLSGNLFYLKVYNRHGEPVTNKEASLDPTHRKLKLLLPPLPDGVYMVSYKVISVDGHPVQSSYTFSVGDVDEPAATGYQAGHHHGGGSIFLIRIAYYTALLILAGWTLWSISTKKTPEKEHSYRQMSNRLKKLYLFVLLAWGMVQFIAIIDGFGRGTLVSLFFSTPTGISWLISFMLALAGFWIVGRSRWIDGIWAVMLLASEAVSGHALVFQPNMLTVPLDFVHLLAAALWSGGLFYLIYLWRKNAGHAKGFLPLFSRISLIALSLLIVTGTLNTLLFLPAVRDILHTWWGWLLMIKTVLVVAVMIIAAFIRSSLKKGDPDAVYPKLKVDFTLMIAILMIVGVFTYVNPIPTNEPFVWKAIEGDIKVTTTVTPREPGIPNRLAVHIQVPRKPNRVRVYLHYKGGEGIAPLEIPVKGSGRGDKGYRYIARHFYIPFAGQWEMVVRILDANDNETVLKKDMMVYPLTSEEEVFE